MNSFEKGFFVSRLRKVLKVDDENTLEEKNLLMEFCSW